MSNIRFTRSNSLDSCEAMFVGLSSPPTETSSSSILHRISLLFAKIFTTRSRIRYELSKLDDSRYLEIYRLLGYDVLNQASECLLSQTQDEMLDEVATAIEQCSFQVQYEIFQVLRISVPWRRLLIITCVTLATMLSFFVWPHGGQQIFSITSANDPCMSTGLSAEVNCTMQHQSVHLGLSADTKSVPTSAFACQRSRYESLLPTGQSKDQMCEVINYEYIHASQERPPEIHRYECQGYNCDHNLAVVHNNLYDVQFINNKQIWGIQVEPTPGCGELEIPAKVITEFSSVEAIQLNFRKPELCKRLFCHISSWGTPHLEYFGLYNAFIATADIKCLVKILEAPTVTAVSFRNSVLCHKCSNLLEQLDPRKFQVIHLLFENYYDEHVQKSSKDFVAKATTLKELRLNVPITEVELIDFMNDYEELKVGEFTVNVEYEAYEQTPFFNLSTITNSQIEELHLRFTVEHWFESERVIITLAGFESVGSNLKKIHFSTTYPNQLIIYTKEDVTDSWDIVYSGLDGIIECLCTKASDLKY